LKKFVFILYVIFFFFSSFLLKRVNGGFLFSQSTISYIIPDIGTSGQNTYIEIIGPYNQNGNFGADGIYSNNISDVVRVACANAADTNKIRIGPIVISWNGKMISTQVFVMPGVNPNTSNWQQLTGFL
jgi:hypothetical protein